MSWSTARAAYERACQGEPVSEAPAADPEARAWALASAALRERVDAPRAVTAAEVRARARASDAARLGAAMAAAEALRSAALAFDGAGVDAHAAALEAVAPPDPEARAQVSAAALWRAVAQARWAEAAERALPLEAQASALGAAALVVEAAALRALALASSGALDEATKIARRASRMARTEALPQPEYLAHWVLARVRRLAGAPHLATRILASLRGVAPPAWWPLLAWETTLSGAATESGPGPAAALGAWVLGLERGDRHGHAARTQRLLHATAGWPSHRADATAWIAAVDPHHPPPPELHAWTHGLTTLAPPALSGLLGWRGQAPPGDSAIAYVLADGPLRRRVPRLTFALVDRARVRVEEQSRLKQGRTEMLTAALALAPPEGIDEPTCFASVYGFPYEPEVHKSIFDVLLHRGREHLAGRGTIARGGGRLALALDAPLLAADPRCTRPLGDALLGVIAEQAGASAKDVAKATGVSLRVVQATLQSLVQDGACQQERGGREVRYVVEDTTYSEPTQRARLIPPADTPGSAG